MRDEKGAFSKNKLTAWIKMKKERENKFCSV